MERVLRRNGSTPSRKYSREAVSSELSQPSIESILGWAHLYGRRHYCRNSYLSEENGARDESSRQNTKSGLLLLCIAFIACGIYMGVAGLSARRTGMLIHGLSPTHAYDWFEAVFGGMVAILAGVGGIWAVLRRQK